MRRNDLTEHEQLFYSDGHQLGQRAAANVSNEKQFLTYIAETYTAIDKLIDSLLAYAQKQGVQVDCKKGCAWCCHQAVFANSYEIHYLGDFIKNNFSPEEINDIKKKAHNKQNKTSKLKEKDVLNYKHPCPLLVNGSCSAYEARPMACRIYLSMKVATCLEFYKNPRKKDSYPALLDFPLKAGRMMNEGFIDALKEKDIQIAEFRLEEGLERILTHGSNL